MRRSVRLFCSPLVSLLCATGIFLDARSLGRDSMVGRVLDPPDVISVCPGPDPWLVLTEDGLAIGFATPGR